MTLSISYSCISCGRKVRVPVSMAALEAQCAGLSSEVVFSELTPAGRRRLDLRLCRACHRPARGKRRPTARTRSALRACPAGARCRPAE